MNDLNASDTSVSNDDPFKAEENQGFKSKLGDFSELEDRIIRFGRSKQMLAFSGMLMLRLAMTCVVIGIELFLDYTFVLNSQTISFNWIKIIMVFVLAVALLIPLSFTFMTYGSHKLRPSLIRKGLSLANVYIGIQYFFIGISVIASVVIFFTFIFRMFLVGLVFGIITGLVFAFYIAFINRAKQLLRDLESAFNKYLSTSYPNPMSLRPFVITLAILTTIGFLLSLTQVANNVSPNTIYSDVIVILNNLSIVNDISLILGIIILFYSIVVINAFDEILTSGSYASTNKLSNPYLVDRNEDDGWRMK